MRAERWPAMYAIFVVLLTVPGVEAVLHRATPIRLRASSIRMHSDTFSMATLTSRITEVAKRPEPEDVRLLMLDAMVPRQRYQLAAPAPLVDSIVESQREGTPLVVMEPHWPNLYAWNEADEVWRPDGLQQPASHGVEVSVAEMGPRGTDGDAIVTLIAGRWCEVVAIGAEEEGSAVHGRSGSVCWRTLDAHAPEEQPTPDLLESSEALGKQVDVWAEYVRAAGSEKSVQQLEARLRSLGEMPSAERPSDRALWVAGLINPSPSGTGGTLAREIRPAVLNAPAAEARVLVVQAALKDSIERLRSWYYASKA